MIDAARRPGFWFALTMSLLLGVGGIWLATSKVKASEASGALVIDCGSALDAKADVVQSFSANGRAQLRHPCDDPIKRRRVLSGVVGLGTIGALIWLGLEISRSEDDEPVASVAVRGVRGQQEERR